jgi:tetratricopeptide repeat protein
MAGNLQLTSRLVVSGLLLASLGPAMMAAGCQQAHPPPPKGVSVDLDPLAKARVAMKRQEYRVALELLGQAVARRPADLEARYRLGVTASHLDRTDDARKEFEWVVAHGRPGTPEVQVARDWLRARRVSSLSAPPPAPVAVRSIQPLAPKPEMATLSGRAVGPNGSRSRLQLFLKGIPGTAVKDEYHILRTDPQGRFRFADVAPGEYMLTDAVAGTPAWRLRVSLAKSEQRVVDLSPANETTIRDDFPDLQ